MPDPNRPTESLGVESPDVESPDVESLDRRVREAFEPRPGTAERLARRALEVSPQRSTRESDPGRRWVQGALALAAAVVLASLLVIPRPHPETPPAVSTIASDTEPAPGTLSISNESGRMTVTTAAGTQWILFSGDSP